MESSRTSLASRTHFEVLGLEASSPRKLPWPRLEDSTIFWTDKILLENARNLAENLRRPFLFCSIGDRLKKNFKTFFAWKIFLKILFFRFFFWRTLAPMSLVLGLEHSCPWPREGLSLEGLSLASSLVSSTPPLIITIYIIYKNYDKRFRHNTMSLSKYLNKYYKLLVFT